MSCVWHLTDEMYALIHENVINKGAILFLERLKKSAFNNLLGGNMLTGIFVLTTVVLIPVILKVAMDVITRTEEHSKGHLVKPKSSK